MRFRFFPPLRRIEASPLRQRASAARSFSEASPLRLRLREVSRQSSKKRGFIPYRFAGQSGAGFTLIELLVVIAIIGLVTTIAVVLINSVRAKGRDNRRTTELKALESAITSYRYNTTLDTIPSPASWAAFKTALSPYFIGAFPSDPTNNTTYRYIYCYGPSTAPRNKFFLRATLENSSAKIGAYLKSNPSGSVYSASRCRASDGAAVSPLPTCTGATSYCLGQRN